MAENSSFWVRLDRLLAAHEVVVDRPKGTCHPRYDQIVYPLDYGYLKDTSGGDGNEIDVWLGSNETQQLTAIACTVDSLKNDTEIKLLLGCTDEEIGIIDHFHNDNEYMSCIIVHRT